jgi:sec-independent protein translocase protein TatC
MLYYFFEFRNRLSYLLISCLFFFVISFFYKEALLYFLVKINIFQSKTNFSYFIYTHLTEVFSTYLLLSFITSLYLSFPIFIIHLFYFIRPGLYPFEYKLFKKFILICICVWFLNNILTYYFFVPFIWNYFCYFDSNILQGPLNLYFEAKLNEYIDLLVSLYILTNLVSQIFFWIYLFILNYNPFDLIFINKSRKYLYLLIFIFASLLTPPDVISQLLFAIPLLILSEFIIIFFLFKNEYLKL